MSADVRLGIGLLVLLVTAVLVLRAAGVEHGRDVATASARAVVQLALVAAALRGVFAAPATVIAALAVMFGVAVWTVTRRLRTHGGIAGIAGVAGVAGKVVLSCGAGSAVVIGVIVGMPTLSRDVRTLVAVSGIVIGGTMTAATLTGRRLADALVRRRDEIEAWLSIGASMRQAVRPIAREAAFEALVPGLDQTRTVGLVTLPGAFVGALLGGADATQAARFQIVVLVGLLCAQSITATLLTRLLGSPGTLPAAD